MNRPSAKEAIADRPIGPVLHHAPTVCVLVGLPGAGKSTWLAQLPGSYVRASIDDLVQHVAQDQGRQFNDVFEEAFPRAESQMWATVYRAVELGLDVALDQTNLTRKARAAKLAAFPAEYQRIAVYFPVEVEVAIERVRQRAALGGHFVPDDVIRDMAMRLEPPERGEFDEVIVRPALVRARFELAI